MVGNVLRRTWSADRYVLVKISRIDDNGFWNIDVDAYDESDWTDWVGKR